MYYLGIDIGSTTLKIALLDGDGRLVYSDYRRHNANIMQTAAEMASALYNMLGNIEFQITITGSVGMGYAERFGLDFVGNKQPPYEFAVVRHVYRRARARGFLIFYSVIAHQFPVAAHNDVAAVICNHARARRVGKRIARRRFAAVPRDNRLRYGMRRIALGNRGKTQYLVGSVGGIYFGYRKVALCQSARFVEHENRCSVEFFEIVGPFYQNSVPRRRPYSGEKRQRNGNNQRART